MVPDHFNFSISSFTASTWGFANLLDFCFFGGILGSMFNLCIIKLGLTPSTSCGLQANTSMFYINDNKSSTQSSVDKLFLIWNHLSEYDRIDIWTNSSTLSTPVDPSVISNCYNGSRSTWPFCLISWFIATTKHFLAIFWLARSTATPSSIGNLIFWCRVNGTAPIAWIQGRPRIAV